MGALALRGVQETAPSIDDALAWHLQFNHYPPVPTSMVGACKRAIANANAGEGYKKVRLPDGVTYRGKRLAPTYAVIEQHHLQDFLTPDEDYYTEDDYDA
jgi:hypothetical protein